MLVTDYLVIGAGAASLAFVDTLLTEQPGVTVTIVDKHKAPGGHWNDAYGFVKLHQPSLLYGVASRQLEGRWLSLLLRGTLPWAHRASKTEILTHYKQLMDSWVASGRVQYYPNSTYNFAKADMRQGNLHSFVDNKTQRTYNIRVQKKLVNGVLGECRVPSQTPPQFPVDKGVSILTPNQVFEEHVMNEAMEKGSWFQSGCKSTTAATDAKKYVVLGCGKTALDTVVFLQRSMGIPAENIKWVAPNDIWMINRNGGESPWAWGSALLHCNGDSDKAALYLEERGDFSRLDPSIMPTKFRFPVVGDDELKLCRNVSQNSKNMIRRGRVTNIERSADGSCYRVSFDKSDETLIVSGDSTFIHCTSPGPFNNNKVRDVFPNENTINLLFLYAPPVPQSLSCIAAIESRLQNGTLDMDFARKLYSASNGQEPMDDAQVLNSVLASYNITGSNDVIARAKDQIQPLQTLAAFLAILDKDPIVSYNWLKNNRLSFFSIPNFKGEVYENMQKMEQAKTALKYSKEQVQQLQLLSNKLKPLEGM